MKRIVAAIMLIQAMLAGIAEVSVSPSMYLPQQCVTAGEKLRILHWVLVTAETSSSSSTTMLVTESKRDYYGGDIVFLNDTLEMVLTPNGYVDSTGRYYFYIKDYQGNIRIEVDEQGNYWSRIIV